MSNCSLSNIILEHMDLNKERDDKKKATEEEAEEEFDIDEGEAEDDKAVARMEGGRDFLKQEFINAAYQVIALVHTLDDQQDRLSESRSGSIFSPS